MALLDFLFGKRDKLEKLPTLNPEQSQFLSSLLGQLGQGGIAGENYQGGQNYLQSLLSPDSDVYGTYEAPYLRAFNEKLVPQLAEKYAGLGALGSSGFAQSLGAAGAGLQENLASMRQGLQQQAAGQSFNQFNALSQLGLGTNSFAYSQREGDPGLFGNILSSTLGGFQPGSYSGILGSLGNALFGNQNSGQRRSPSQSIRGGAFGGLNGSIY